jgi:hypothetical protein
MPKDCRTRQLPKNAPISAAKRTIKTCGTSTRLQIATSSAADQVSAIAKGATGVERLVRMAYLIFAATHPPRWRALFEHRPPQGKAEA